MKYYFFKKETKSKKRYHYIKLDIWLVEIQRRKDLRLFEFINISVVISKKEINHQKQTETILICVSITICY